MSELWKRVVKVTLSGSGSGVVITDLKIEFDVTRTIGSRQNTATLKIWNLSRSSRMKLGREWDKVKIEAGHERRSVGVIFDGQIRDTQNQAARRQEARIAEGTNRGVVVERSTADIISTITLGDGDRAINRGAVSRTWPAGTHPRTIIRDVVGTMPDARLGPMVGLDDLPAYRRPVSVFGWSFRVLDMIGRDHALYWSIQSNEVQVLRNDRALSDTITCSKDTGLVGIPKRTDKGVEFQHLLLPEFAPGKKVKVTSDMLKEMTGSDGETYRIAEVKFHGSNRDTPFYADVKADKMNGDRVQS